MPSPNFIPTTGVHNFRDYGGYAAGAGGRVKRGLLYRSGQHSTASDADLAKVADAGLATVIDLRGPSERAANVCRRPAGFDAQVLFHDGETSSRAPHEAAGSGEFDAGVARQRMIALYDRMPTNPAMVAMFSRYFEALAEQAEGVAAPSLVHCFAGKDRTGVAAALLHRALGVHDDDAMADYLLTNDAPTMHVLVDQASDGLRARWGGLSDADLRVILSVEEAYLAQAYSRMTAESGSIDAYMEQVLGVDDTMREQLRARYLD
ncbi:Protein-tyrosine-phosphatase [Alteripontixanthobacter maritimus]|uniref:Protein-tyrosine-phosphatase n=1 Tax=Alteripontixanthobacter maritimus TaxID=2161824 RepID=A0A369Q562_9SPHN|nr:tyrosine-protein phosphatase [Alteripontixanthobacter maritimus]RDC59612.1 Protein-tyrosine-phosphatase [Alteripontixanthobacter maritimus]